MSCFRCIFVVIAVGLALCDSARAEVNYTVTDLGTLGGTYSAANDVNNAGEIVGESYTASETKHAFLYRGGVINDLGLPPGFRTTSSSAVAINAASQILVNSNADSGPAAVYRNGVWDRSFTSFYGSDINDFGLVTGNTGTSILSTGIVYSLTNHTIVYSIGSNFSVAATTAVNNRGQVIGTFSVRLYPSRQYETRGYRYDLNTKVIEDLGGLYPAAINDAGEIASGNAVAINNYGVKVGHLFSSDNNYLRHATLFSQDGLAFDLNTLIPRDSGLELLDARGINDLGQIVGSALTSTGEQHAFLLTPFPEPASMSSALLGLAMLLGRRRERRKGA